MNGQLMERLQVFLRREDNHTLVGKPASREEIAAAEQQLDVRFHEDYIQFIQTFGGAYAGLAIHAFANGSSIGNESVVDLTLEFREQYSEPHLAELLKTSYVVSMDGSGDPILITQDGKVLICYHDSSETNLLANSFEALIEDNFFELSSALP